MPATWPASSAGAVVRRSAWPSRCITAFGFSPASISHEGYSAKPMHSYWDDFWALKGYDAAVDIATALDHGDAARTTRRRHLRERQDERRLGRHVVDDREARARPDLLGGDERKAAPELFAHVYAKAARADAVRGEQIVPRDQAQGGELGARAEPHVPRDRFADGPERVLESG